MTSQKVVIIFGLPGVGKTTLINEVLKNRNDFVRLSGGSLINEELSEEERDILRKQTSDQILSNQEILLYNYKKKREALGNKHIIFDGHCVIKSENSLTVIPYEVIQRLNPDIIIFLDENSETITERRSRDDKRPDREIETVADLDKNRDLQLEVCQDYTRKLDIPMKIFNSPKSEEINTVLDEICIGTV